MKSMTGFGAARRDVDDTHLTVEAKSVNGRFLKTAIKLPPFLAAHEGAVEGLAKARLRRGSVSVSVYASRSGAEALVQVNETMVRAYQEVFTRLGLGFDTIPSLPGVIGQAERGEASPALLKALQEAAGEAFERLDAMRMREGEALGMVLLQLCDAIDQTREAVRTRAPAVVLEYRDKLRARLATLLAGVDVPVDPQTLAREVAVFADRSDITEEVDRLGAHLQQARDLLSGGDEVGRTLDFLAQEMHREINTMGAKSADTQLSRAVLQLKTDVERFKEQVANVE